MSILCRIGLHAWKPIGRYVPLPMIIIDFEQARHGITLDWPYTWVQVGHVCRHCRKRVVI